MAGRPRAISARPAARALSTVTASILPTSSSSGTGRPQAHDLPRQLFRARAGALQRHQQSGLHLRLYPRHLGLVDGVGCGMDLAHNHAHQFRQIRRIGTGIKTEHSGVGIGRMERIDRVAQTALLTHLLE